MDVTNINILKSSAALVLDPKVAKAAQMMLPAYLMYAIGLQAAAVGLELREDFYEHLRRHMVKAVEGLDELSQARVSKLVEERSLELMTAVNTQNPIACLYVILYCIMKAVDEGVITDVTSQPVLYSVLMINESEDMGFAYTFNRPWVKQKAGEMFSTVYYNTYF
ncbi:hypothetical protein EVB27_130 [Rhizobium phage RHph_TM16]|nr:hypothetical protein EVB27_130 [Rhizobium phage RHph_TM16]